MQTASSVPPAAGHRQPVRFSRALAPHFPYTPLSSREPWIPCFRLTWGLSCQLGKELGEIVSNHPERSLPSAPVQRGVREGRSPRTLRLNGERDSMLHEAFHKLWHGLRRLWYTDRHNPPSGGSWLQALRRGSVPYVRLRSCGSV
jgi:hypothetical protein